MNEFQFVRIHFPFWRKYQISSPLLIGKWRVSLLIGHMNLTLPTISQGITGKVCLIMVAAFKNILISPCISPLFQWHFGSFKVGRATAKERYQSSAVLKSSSINSPSDWVFETFPLPASGQVVLCFPLLLSQFILRAGVGARSGDFSIEHESQREVTQWAITSHKLSEVDFKG